MADYLEVVDAQVEPGAPVTSALVTQLRDNPLASIEGSVGAPKLANVWLAGGVITPSAATQAIPFVGLTQYAKFNLHLYGLRPATDNAALLIRTSSNGGSSYDSGASDYNWINNTAQSSGDNDIVLSTDLGNDATESANLTIDIHNPWDSSQHTCFSFHGVCKATTGFAFWERGSGSRLSAGIVDAVQIRFNPGNIAEGWWVLTGVPA